MLFMSVKKRSKIFALILIGVYFKNPYLLELSLVVVVTLNVTGATHRGMRKLDLHYTSVYSGSIDWKIC